MQIDEFIALVASEPERAVTKTVRVPSRQTLAAASRPGGMRLTDFMSAPATVEQRDFRFRHVLGAPATRQTIEDWQARHPTLPLPPDLRALVERVNGIHLWADCATGRSYVGLAPIEEWEAARLKMYGPSASPKLLADRYLALSYHQDNAAFAVLDPDSATYYLMDAAGPDLSTPIGKNVDALLSWLWNSRVFPAT